MMSVTKHAQDVFNKLRESFRYEECFKRLIFENGGSSTSLSGQENHASFPSALFILVGSIRRQKKDGEILKPLMMLAMFLPICCRQPKPKSSLLSSGSQSSEDDSMNATIGGSSYPVGDPPGTLSFGTSRPEAEEPPISTSPSISFLHPKAELGVPPALPSQLPTTSSDGVDGTEDIASYSMTLKELGDKDGKYGVYVEKRVKLEPPLWKCTVTFREVQGVGESSKKRTAKHIASRSAYLQLGYSALV